MTWCRRRAKCHFCEGFVEAGQPIVKGKLWMRSDGSTRRWCVRLYWHPHCWVNEGLAYLETHPYQPANKGRPPLALSETAKNERLKLLRARARTMQFIRQRLDGGASWTDPAVIRLVEKLISLCDQIIPLGGMPKSWLKPIVEAVGNERGLPIPS